MKAGAVLLSLLLGLTACGGGKSGAERPEAVQAKPARAACSTTAIAKAPIDTGPLAVDIYAANDNDGLSAEERRLYQLIMQHRAELGLPSIPLSSSLTLVAGRHAEDTAKNILPSGGPKPGTNLHSWSDVPYYPDHSNARYMWQSPQRLGTPYCGSGYEISGVGYPTTERALAGWLSSNGHRSVIENQGIWKEKDWQAIGIGIAYPNTGDYQTVYHVWFGAEPDPAGPPR